MTEGSAKRSEVRARILYWGPEGAGTSANLAHVAHKLRADHRGELRRVPTALDPTVAYEVLPISLGEIAGTRVQLEVVAVPGGAEHAPTRKQLLDRADGVVLVLDATPGRLEADLEAFEELRRSLGAYGRPLDELPLVVQYNKCDRSDELTLEELHRKLDLRGVAVFEAVAREGKGVLPTLTTISKRVIRYLRELELAEGTARGARPLEEPDAEWGERSGPETQLEPVPPPVAPEPDTAASLPDPEPEPASVLDAPEAEPASVFDEPELETAPPLDPVEAGIVEEERDPIAGQEADALARRAEVELGDSWEEMAGGPAKEDPSDPELRLASVGEPRRTPAGGWVVPVEIEDADGRRVDLRLALRIDLLPGADED